MDVRARAVGTAVGPLPGVELVVELEVDELREAGRTELALVGPLARVEPLVGLQVTGAAESFVANLRRSGSRQRRFCFNRRRREKKPPRSAEPALRGGACPPTSPGGGATETLVDVGDHLHRTEASNLVNLVKVTAFFTRQGAPNYKAHCS